MKIITILLLLAVFPTVFAQSPADSQQFIRVEAPVVALTHVRLSMTLALSHAKIKRSSSPMEESWAYHPAAAFVNQTLVV